MLALEHSRRHPLADQVYDLDQTVQAPFPGLTMDAYDQQLLDPITSFHPLPFSFFENPAAFAAATAPMPALKQEMHQLHELPPALISSGSAPSIPSASSSTVGSPYSGPSHLFAHESFDHANAAYGLEVMPTIVSQDSFSQDLLSVSLDSDLSLLGPEKLADSYVGESADLSSSPSEASTICANPAPQSVHLPFSSCGQSTLPATPSSDRLSISIALDQGVSPASSFAAGPMSVFRPAATSPLLPPGTWQSASTPTFKSPTTPASTRTGRHLYQTPATTATTPSPRPPPSLSPCSPSQHSDALMQPFGAYQAPPHTPPVNSFQSRFFAQSSGNFLPPLESSYPSLIHASRSYGDSIYPDPGLFPHNMPSFTAASPSASPAPSPAPYGMFATTHFSDPLTSSNFFPHSNNVLSRRPSLSSYASAPSASRSTPTSELDDESREKGRCPHAECGRVFKDLKAHMLTHQAERPEKCPIVTCEYNQKGFARKYDKNRHTLTHYKGTMVCGFCPGSGSPAEKSFNRADVFKRHLTSVHGVEQTAPNSRKRSPTANSRKLSSYCQDATGKCSTCSATFTNAQDFYEHLDDCVLRVVQQEEPSEAINEQHLASVRDDNNVQETMDRHMIQTDDVPSMTTLDDDDDDDDDDEDEDETEITNPTTGGRSGKGALKSNKPSSSGKAGTGAGVSKSKPMKKGMTWSKGGVALVGKGRKKRKHYPPSWGMSAEKMSMKKRVLCVYDGQRRLLKDDMMLHSEFEVRIPLADGKTKVTDLDVMTLRRADAFHNTTEEERGPWLPPTEDDNPGFDLNALMA